MFTLWVKSCPCPVDWPCPPSLAAIHRPGTRRRPATAELLGASPRWNSAWRMTRRRRHGKRRRRPALACVVERNRTAVRSGRDQGRANAGRQPRRKGLSVKIRRQRLLGEGPRPRPGDNPLQFGDDGNARRTTPFLLRQTGPHRRHWGSLLGFRLAAQLAGDTATVLDACRPEVRSARQRPHRFKTPVGPGTPAIQQFHRAIGWGFRNSRRARHRRAVAGRFPLRRQLCAGRIQRCGGRTRWRDQQSGQRPRVARPALFFEPWKNDAITLSGLGFGIAATTGDKHGSSSQLASLAIARRARCRSSSYVSDVNADGEAAAFRRRPVPLRRPLPGCSVNTSCRSRMSPRSRAQSKHAVQPRLAADSTAWC